MTSFNLITSVKALQIRSHSGFRPSTYDWGGEGGGRVDII